MARSFLGVVLLALTLLGTTTPTPAVAQEPAPLSWLEALGIATEDVGLVTVHFAPADKQYAQQLAARTDLAVMAVTTDGRVPDEVVNEIAGSDGFVSGRSITL